MTEYELDPEVCPSSLNEHGVPLDPSETGHVWDPTEDIIVCNECGATKDPVTKEGALKTLAHVFDYYFEGADHETQIDVIEAERYIKANLK